MTVMDDAFDPHWGEAWTRQQVAGSLAMPHTYALVIDSAGQVGIAAGTCEPAGFALIRRAPGEEELLLIGVRPKFRRHGFGRRLLEAFFAEARRTQAQRVFLEMRANNPAQSLYAALGFERIGRRPDYYRLGDGSRIDAITFGKSL
ncbi:MAG: GNAT family N-acetyltransferase [Erythrobacter sp.]|nr:GNAT family N-acetyltransferase [Erythrobacter sp.]